MGLISTGVTNMEVRSSTKSLHITELRERIMDELDPLTMFNLISTSRSALHTFERDPERYIKAALKHVPLEIAQAILEAHRRAPSVAELDDVLYRYYNRLWLASDSATYTVQSLQTLAAVYAGVETLLYSRIWKCVEDPEDGASSFTESSWSSEVDEIYTALWYFHLYCILFHRRPNTEHGEVEFPSITSQYKFIHILKQKEEREVMDRFRSVYKDLSSFLAKSYKHIWTLSFKDVYMNHVNRSNTLKEEKQWPKEDWPYSKFNYCIYSPHKTDPLESADDGFWSDPIVAYDTYGDFFKYVDYHMSMGVPFLARMYRLSLDPHFFDFPEQTFWTESFFPQAYDKLHGGYAQIRDTCDSQLYLLQPCTCEAESRGYVLYLTVPSTGGEYLVKSSDCLFTDTDFEPPHLGNLKFVKKSTDGEEPKETAMSEDEDTTSDADNSTETNRCCDADISTGTNRCCDADEAEITAS